MAPDFKSTTQDGEPLTLADLKGQRTILYFYPKDNTSGCTLEAKSLRDGKAELTRMGFRIIGVSPDSEKSHRNFCDKHELNFTLLADTDHSVCEAYGVWAEKSMYGRKYMGVLRTTFVIDAEGRIEKIFTKVDTKNHYRQIIDSYKTGQFVPPISGRPRVRRTSCRLRARPPPGTSSKSRNRSSMAARINPLPPGLNPRVSGRADGPDAT